MNAIATRIPIRFTPFTIFGLMLAIVGCGTIAIDVRTQILSQQEIRQEIEYTISGPIATLMITDGEVSLDDASPADLEALEATGWDFELDVIEVDGEDAVRMRISQTFTGEDAAEQFRLASEALAEQDDTSSMIPFLEITETEDEIVYDLRMSIDVEDPSASEPATDFPNLGGSNSDPALDPLDAEFNDAFSDGLDEFTDALTSSLEDFMTVKWTVEMPGNVDESNATSEDGDTLIWDLGFSDLTEGDEELFARSTVSKNSGSCNS